MSDVAILTACFGGYDQLRPQVAQDLDVDWLCITDEPAIPPPWTVISEGLDDHLHPRMAAKAFKLLPFAAVPHPIAIWIDASMEIRSRRFAREAIACLRDGLATWRHPQRDCIYEEAEASIELVKYAGLPIREQVEHYQAEGHPEHAGLYACGTIVWNTTRADVRELGEAWLMECERWTYQDQLSLPVLCRRRGISPGVFPHRQITSRSRTEGWLANPWLRIWPHLSDR